MNGSSFRGKYVFLMHCCGVFDFDCLPDPHPAALSLPLLNRTKEKTRWKSLLVDKEITLELLSQAKQT